MKIYLTAALALATLAGCNDIYGGAKEFDREVGSRIDNGTFGGATMNNHLVQTGASGTTINLQRRFAGEVDTTVNFAFNSAVLDADARATLTQQASWIRQFPEVRFNGSFRHRASIALVWKLLFLLAKHSLWFQPSRWNAATAGP